MHLWRGQRVQNHTLYTGNIRGKTGLTAMNYMYMYRRSIHCIHRTLTSAVPIELSSYTSTPSSDSSYLKLMKNTVYSFQSCDRLHEVIWKYIFTDMSCSFHTEIRFHDYGRNEDANEVYTVILVPDICEQVYMETRSNKTC